MRFLCVPCDQPMRLLETTPPDRGSMSVRYGCDACGYEMAMLTNPYETQMVQSLGVRIGPAGAASAEGSPVGATPGSAPAAGASGAAASGGCPFAQAVANPVAQPAVAGVPWTPAAEARLQSIPSFVRTMARGGIEGYARERGYAEIDERVMDEARSHFGM